MAVSAPRPPVRERYHKGLSKEDILDAALQILREGTLEDLTLARVAKLLGVSAPAVYHHFPNKDALLAATAALGFKHLTSLYKEVASKQKDLNSWIRARGSVYIRFAFEEPGLHQLMYRHRFADRNSYPELMAAEDECFSSSVAHIADAKGRRPRQFFSHNSVTDFPVSMTIWSAFHGLATLIADGHMKTPTQKTIDKLAASIADVLTNRNEYEFVPAPDED
jgi:AcrR family transcriptional regulator